MKFVRDCLRPPLIWDSLALLGLKLMFWGLWWVYPPLALIVVGGLMILLGIWGAASWAKDRRSSKHR